jgi:hypothetical protein
MERFASMDFTLGPGRAFKGCGEKKRPGGRFRNKEPRCGEPYKTLVVLNWQSRMVSRFAVAGNVQTFALFLFRHT